MSVQSVKMNALRDAFGNELVKIGGLNKNIVVLDADTSSSTRSGLFGKAYPERFFDAGLIEVSMMGIAAGLASSGKKVFVAGFASFMSGMVYNTVRQSICYPNLDVNIVATHAGITVGEDGATHQMLEDLGIMAGLPNMKVVAPADAPETARVIDAVANDRGPFYVRLSREKVADVTEGYDFKLGRGLVMREGGDIALISTGILLGETLEAAGKLKKDGISATVVDMASVKPIDADLIVKVAKQTGLVMTVEEHSVYNGLGSRVAEVLSERQPTLLKRHGMYDVFGESGTAQELLKKYKLNSDGIAEVARDFVEAMRK
ncbi:MAG: transketolase family protein [Thermoprotei archaeon]